MDRTDQQLVASYLSGNEDALKILIGRYLKTVYNFVYRIIGNLQDTQDITQEVFIKIWKHIEKYDQRQNFKTWIFTIAHNAALDWLRKKRNLVFSDFENSEHENYLEHTLIDPKPLPDEIIAQMGDQKFVSDLLSQLPLIYREVMILRYSNELTFEEIAEILKRPVDTVKSQHRRALVVLRRFLDAPKSNLNPY